MDKKKSTFLCKFIFKLSFLRLQGSARNQLHWKSICTLHRCVGWARQAGRLCAGSANPRPGPWAGARSPRPRWWRRPRPRPRANLGQLREPWPSARTHKFSQNNACYDKLTSRINCFLKMECREKHMSCAEPAIPCQRFRSRSRQALG